MLAGTSSTQLSYLEEVTFGVIDQVGTPKKLRMTGESLAYDITLEESKEINSTMQVSDLVPVGATAQGGINLEFQYREYDPFLEALLASVYTELDTGGVRALASVVFAAAGNTATVTGVGDFTGLVAGQWVSFIGSAGTELNRGVFRIAIATTSVLTFDTDYPVVDETAKTTYSITGSRLTLGSAALKTFTIQKEFSDVAQFFAYRGMAVSKLSLALATGALLTGSLDFMGSDSIRTGATQFGAAAGAATAYGIMNAVTGVGKILLDGDPVANTFVKSANVTIDAKLRAQTGLGVLGNVGIGRSTYAVGGSLEIYLNDGAIYDKALANTTVSIQFPVKDVLGNGYAFTFNNCKLGVPTVQASGKDADVMLSVTFTAIAPGAADKVVYIDRFGTAP
jgi:hypothetical protein